MNKHSVGWISAAHPPQPLAVREAPASYVLEAQRVRPGYKMTEVGVIPEDWDYLPIADSIDLLTGFPFPSSGYASSGVRLMRGSNVKRGVTDWSEDGTEYWPLVTADIRKYVLKSGDIVIAMDGSLVGRSFAMLSDEDVPSLLLQRVARIRSNSIDQKYLKAWICSLRFTEHCDSVKTVSAIPHISPGDIRSFKVVLPPTKAEQKAIAEALSDADALIEALEQLIAKKRHLKQGAMQQLLTGNKRLPGFSGEWEVKRLGDVIEKFVGGGTPSRSNPQYWGNEIPWVTVKDFATFDPRSAQEAITKTGLQNSASHLVPKGALITSTRMALGKAVVYEVDVAINQDLKALFPKPDLATQFLYFWFQYHGQSIDELGSGSTVKGISLPDLKKIEFSLPLLPEQTAIATILSDMDTEIAALEARLAKARGIKQGMMQELLIGNIRLVSPLATSKSPSIGHPKSPRQDGQIMSLLRCFEQIELRPL